MSGYQYWTWSDSRRIGIRGRKDLPPPVVPGHVESAARSVCDENHDEAKEDHG